MGKKSEMNQIILSNIVVSLLIEISFSEAENPASLFYPSFPWIKKKRAVFPVRLSVAVWITLAAQVT